MWRYDNKSSEVKKSDKNISRLAILNYITSNYLNRWGGVLPGKELITKNIPEGSLVVMSMYSQINKYYISWLRKIIPPNDPERNNVFEEYLLESIEDGEECYWTNIQLLGFPKNDIMEIWYYTDEQHIFKSKLGKYNKHYSVIPLFPVFDNENGTVTIKCREKWEDFNENTPKLTIPFKKYKVKDIKDYFDLVDNFFHKKLKSIKKTTIFDNES